MTQFSYQNPLLDPNSDTLIDHEPNSILIVWNDDVNTFDWVIESLIDICDHSPEQAEQSALLIHYKGKCDVKRGTVDFLIPMEKELLERGISAQIFS